MDADLSSQGAQADPSGPLRSNGRAWGTAFGTASGACTAGSWRPHRCRRSFRHLTEFGTVRSSQGPPDARHLVTACRATRDGHASRRSATLTQCRAYATAVRIYRYQHSCSYTKAMADVGKKLSTLFSAGEKIRSVAPLCPTCDAVLAAGHHGCALTCQAPICLAYSRHTALNGIA
jgi:hypothetical protein